MKTTFKTLAIIVTLGLFTNCSNSSDDDGGKNSSCYQSLINATVDYTDILEAYQLNPSETTCNSLKQASINLISAYGNCEQYLQEEENAALEAAAQEWKNLDCSEI